MTQLVIPENRKTIERAFNEFHAKHPEVYDDLVALARELRRRGYRKFGIKTLYEVARWRSWMRAEPGREFKLNNNFTAYYARLIMAREADLDGVFDTRRLAIPHHVAP